MNEQSIFTAALDHDPSDRHAFLEAACEGRPEMRQRVDKLLASHENAGSFMAQPASELASPDAPPLGEQYGDGRSVGYELLHDLDRQYPGIRFRMVNEQDEMRPHIIFFVGGQRTRNIEEPLAGAGEVVILHALSGG